MSSNTNNLFTRRETVELTDLTLNQLVTLEKNNLVEPIRDETLDPTSKIFYDWARLIELRAIRKLRENCSLQTLRKAVTVLDELQIEVDFSDKRLIAYGNDVFWINDSPEELATNIIQLTGKVPGQILITFTYEELICELWERSTQVIDFERRAKDKPDFKVA